MKTAKQPMPIGGLYDPRFKYVPAIKTDIRATIERVRREIKQGKRKL